MPDLYPTPTRLEMLRDAAAGYVAQFRANNKAPIRDWRTDRRVTARVRKLVDAGWLARDEADDGTLFAKFRPTDAGRAVLDANPEVRRA